jgi:hypothetical protein
MELFNSKLIRKYSTESVTQHTPTWTRPQGEGDLSTMKQHAMLHFTTTLFDAYIITVVNFVQSCIK